MVGKILGAIWVQRKVVVFIYLIQLILAFGLGMQVWQVMEASIGDSMRMDDIEDNFSRTVFEDFLQVHGSSVTPILGMMRWLLPVYLILSIFFHAGIIFNLIHQKGSIFSMLQGGRKYFVKCGTITLTGIIVLITLSMLIWLPYFSIIGNPIEFYDSETGFVHSLMVLGIIQFILIGILWWFTYVLRYLVIRDKLEKIPWKQGLKLGAKSLPQYLGTSLIFISILVLVYFSFHLITSNLTARSILLIGLLFLLQQSFNLFRIGMRVGFYEALKEYLG